MFMIQLLGSDVYIMIMVTNEITMSACHTNIFEADNIKTLPKCNFTFCFPFFVSLWAPQVTLLTTTGAFPDPQLAATASNVCPKTKILAMPVHCKYVPE